MKSVSWLKFFTPSYWRNSQQEGITKLGPFRADWNSVFSVLYSYDLTTKTQTAKIFLEDSPPNSKPVALLEITLEMSDAERGEQLAKDHSSTLQAAISYFLKCPDKDIENQFPGKNAHIRYKITRVTGSIYDPPLEVPGSFDRWKVN